MTHLGRARQDVIPVHHNKCLLGLAFAAVHQILQDLAIRLCDEACWNSDVPEAAPRHTSRRQTVTGLHFASMQAACEKPFLQLSPKLEVLIATKDDIHLGRWRHQDSL